MKNQYLRFVIILTFLFRGEVYGQYTKEDYTKGKKNSLDFTEIYFVGTGDVQQNLAKTKDELAASTGVGVVFWRMFGPKFHSLELQLEARISIASTVDTISGKYINNELANMRDFGSYVSAPLARGQSTAINTIWYFKDNASSKHEKTISGFQFDFIAANQVFKDSVNSMNASILGVRGGIFHEFVPTDKRLLNGISIRLGLNYSFRGLRGDLGTSSPRSNQLRESLLGVNGRIFHGPECFLALKLKNLKAQASLPIIFPKKGIQTYGLTGTQFITTISFIGGFPLQLEN